MAQSYMVDTCVAAGFGIDQLLTEEGALLEEGLSAVSVATDDMLHFFRGSEEEADSDPEFFFSFCILHIVKPNR